MVSYVGLHEIVVNCIVRYKAIVLDADHSAWILCGHNGIMPVCHIGIMQTSNCRQQSVPLDIDKSPRKRGKISNQ